MTAGESRRSFRTSRRTASARPRDDHHFYHHHRRWRGFPGRAAPRAGRAGRRAASSTALFRGVSMTSSLPSFLCFCCWWVFSRRLCVAVVAATNYHALATIPRRVVVARKKERPSSCISLLLSTFSLQYSQKSAFFFSFFEEIFVSFKIRLCTLSVHPKLNPNKNVLSRTRSRT